MLDLPLAPLSLSPSAPHARPSSLLRSPLLALNPVFPSSPRLSLSDRTPSTPPPSPALNRPTHVQRVARATREFRDVWIVPE
ncbi:unnamed protein product [Chondrus crispus]|uniref:Uncharacterized protein n=1 Tax=Chondrus crispus TaxID=2769 RepID=R7Q435_CHOCR|nr:unnamed protein product [Chondrus crispus]CDF32101.1 unnamed protein product [Chondrus crispus]|eukprot:XP_005711766.1 unnamed protein product [Chondrus crispus]